MQEFAIAPAGLKPLWVLIPVLIIVLVVIAIVGRSVAGSRTATFQVSPEGLRLRGDFFGRLIPMASLRPGDARRVDLGGDSPYRPRLRTMGTGLPGYQAGWFRLANGESALLYLTDRSKAVLVPTTLGYSVLVSPADPDGFLAALESQAKGPLNQFVSSSPPR